MEPNTTNSKVEFAYVEVYTLLLSTLDPKNLPIKLLYIEVVSCQASRPSDAPEPSAHSIYHPSHSAYIIRLPSIVALQFSSYGMLNVLHHPLISMDLESLGIHRPWSHHVISMCISPSLAQLKYTRQVQKQFYLKLFAQTSKCLINPNHQKGQVHQVNDCTTPPFQIYSLKTASCSLSSTMENLFTFSIEHSCPY